MAGATVLPRAHRGLDTQLSLHTQQVLHLNNSVPHIKIYRMDIATASWKFISVCEGLRCRRKGFRKGATLHLGWSVLQSRHRVIVNCEERPMYWVSAHSTNILHCAHCTQKWGGKPFDKYCMVGKHQQWRFTQPRQAIAIIIRFGFGIFLCTEKLQRAFTKECSHGVSDYTPSPRFQWHCSISNNNQPPYVHITTSF